MNVLSPVAFFCISPIKLTEIIFHPTPTSYQQQCWHIQNEGGGQRLSESLSNAIESTASVIFLRRYHFCNGVYHHHLLLDSLLHYAYLTKENDKCENE